MNHDCVSLLDKREKIIAADRGRLVYGSKRYATALSGIRQSFPSLEVKTCNTGEVSQNTGEYSVDRPFLRWIV
jgi:hypothetical protein